MNDLISKSQKKRDAQALVKMGETLVGWKEEVLKTLPLSEKLFESILEAKRLKSFGAIKRQQLLIGKLLRESDYQEITEAYEAILTEQSAQTADFHGMEVWRDRLMNEGKSALTEFIDRYQPEDIQTLRQLIKKACDDHRLEKNTGASKALFRYIRSCLS